MPRKNPAQAPIDDRPPPRKPSARSSLKARRSGARMSAVQIIYQSELNKQSLPQALAEYSDYRIGQIVDGIEIVPADPETLKAIVQGVEDHDEAIREVMRAALRGTTPERIETLLRSILRAGIAELMLRQDQPVGLIISDYLSVVDAFYAGPEIKLINAALDAAARAVRVSDPTIPAV